MACDKLDNIEQLVQILNCVVATDECIPNKRHDRNFQAIQRISHSFEDSLNKYHIPVLGIVKTRGRVKGIFQIKM